MAHTLYINDPVGSVTVDFLDECGTGGWCQLADGGLDIKTPSKKQTWSGSNVWRQGRTLAKNLGVFGSNSVLHEAGLKALKAIGA